MSARAGWTRVALRREVGPRVFGVVLADPRALFDLARGLRDRFADLLGDGRGVLAGVLAQVGGRVCEHRLALPERPVAPGLECARGPGNCRFEVCRRGWLVGGDQFAGRRIVCVHVSGFERDLHSGDAAVNSVCLPAWDMATLFARSSLQWV